MATLHLTITTMEYQWFVAAAVKKQCSQRALLEQLVRAQMTRPPVIMLFVIPEPTWINCQIKIDPQLKRALQQYLRPYQISLTLFIRTTLDQTFAPVDQNLKGSSK